MASLTASRRASGVRQVELAARLDKPQSYVSKIERGERGLDVAEFISIVHAIGLNPVTMLTLALDPEFDESEEGWHWVLHRLGAKPVAD